MGTEVLHPQDSFFINVPPVIVRKEPDLKPNCENGDDSYAGSGFFHSPSPRSLPLPSFFNKKQEEESMAMAEDHGGGFDDSATKHLCRLLRLG
ncbi:hypothetical protein SSX86_014991 [Deinandra increscens subsp. villosa]|uniref:Uncharacterized protein n=1 Tax=Deinandra increscens subsp. villosa TaxID=3103831 RepID=A0AAP0CYY6_9ASTR